MATALSGRAAAQLRYHLLPRLQSSTKYITKPRRTFPIQPQVQPYSTTSETGASRNMFSYHVAASFIAKDRPYNPSTHVYHYKPDGKKHLRTSRDASSARPESGHDAFFVSPVNESGAVAFGVADGVGGWVDSGVDPADFSHGLCGYMADAAKQHKSDDTGRLLSARSLMQKGYDAVCRDRSLRAGGSTACVAIARPDGTVDIANLGDSGFIHLRLNAVHDFSEPQTHDFNTPFQLSLIPPSVAARMATYGGAQLSDLPRDADVSEHDLRHGDILLFATDGVLDNLFNQDILRIASHVMVSTGAWEMAETGGVRVSNRLPSLVQPQGSETEDDTLTLQSLISTQMVGAAKRASVNTRVDGPFAKEVQRYFPQENWRGGKVDDICVVAAVVCREGATLEKSKL